MVIDGPGEVLHGRRREREVLERLLKAVRGGQSRVLVVTGEPGVGKTALLESAGGSAQGFQVARAAGVESEMELAFAALQQLCAPILDRIDHLPARQRDALGVAFGLRVGDPPDRFMVGLAALGLLAEVAGDEPLVCLVDDAQWLDRASAQALGFVARRLVAESVALVFATREINEELAGLPKLALDGLRDDDARALLGSVVRAPLDEGVRERIIAETRGNPLALLELPHGLTPAELAGGFGLLDAVGLSGRIETSFRRRLEGLPAETQQLLLLAAAEPLGDPVLVRRAAHRLGVGNEAAADTNGLLAIGARVTFRHPLARSAVYHAASPQERQTAHRALADATDADVDPDRRAWHLAHATPAFDEEVASELERSAGRAQARGGLAAAAAFLERAVGLTVDPALRARRALAAAQAKHLAGAPDAAVQLLAIARTGPPDELASAQIDLLGAQIAFASSRGSDAPPLLLAAAKRLEALDIDLARETYLDALSAAQFAGRLAGSVGAPEVARAALAAPPPQHPRASDLLLTGLATRSTAGYAAAAPTIQRALRAFRSDRISAEEELRWLWLACRHAGVMWDHESWDVLSARHLKLAREAGALTVLPLALNIRIAVDAFAGELATAALLTEELRAITEATGERFAPYGPLLIGALQGRESEAPGLIEEIVHEVTARGEGLGLAAAEWARAALYNGLGRYGDALVAAERAVEHPEGLTFFNWGLVELVEAAVRDGAPERGAGALQQLSEMARSTATDWALGVEARSLALVSADDSAERSYREAIERLERTRVHVELARAHLVYGEWLRRRRRRVDAREQLRSAHELFTEFGMEAFAERTRGELEATGEHARRRTAETRDDLTPQEAQIARRAADGATNQEIAAQLFISPSTVDYHLRKAFRKLGVKSRHQLQQRVLEAGASEETVARTD